LIDAEIVSGEAAFVLFPKSFEGTFSNQEIVTQSDQLLLVPGSEGLCYLALRNTSNNYCSVKIKNIEIRNSKRISSNRVLQSKVNRHSYWHYNFDFGDGVYAKANIAGIQESHTLNFNAINSLINRYFDKSISSMTDFGCSQGYYSFNYGKQGISSNGHRQ